MRGLITNTVPAGYRGIELFEVHAAAEAVSSRLSIISLGKEKTLVFTA